MPLSVSRMKALKRERCNGLSWHVPTDSGEWPGEDGGYALLELPAGPHAPNKNEAKALRRICSRTGLTESQVREHLRYRQELARAATPSSHGRHPAYRRAVKVRKAVIAQTQLHPQHPAFLAAFEKAWLAQTVGLFLRYGQTQLTPAQALAMSMRKRAPA